MNGQNQLNQLTGSHLVKIIGIKPERMPSLEEIKPRVLIDLDLQKKDSALSEYLNNLKDEYEIIISRSLEQTYNE